MTQTPGEREAQALREARSRLIKTERARQNLTQAGALNVINERLQANGHDPISRAHLASIETNRRELSEPILRAIAAALGLSEAQLRHPLVSAWEAA